MTRSKHARKPRVDRAAWRHSSAGMVAYSAAKKDAQEKANLTGHDYGIEPNDLFKSWHVFILPMPMRQNRYGHELTCEVVWPTKLDTCKPGHGPLAG